MVFALRLRLILVGAVAYLALAVLGWGGPAALFSHPARTALAVALAVLAVLAGAALLAGGNLSSGVREDRGNRWVIAAFALIGLLGGYLPAYTDRKEFWAIDGDAVRWLGVTLFAAGGALRLWLVFVLGQRFSGLVAIQPGHTLVSGGVYGLIRHPSYLGLLVNSLGWRLAFRSGGWRAAHGAPHSAAAGAHPGGGGPPPLGGRRLRAAAPRGAGGRQGPGRLLPRQGDHAVKAASRWRSGPAGPFGQVSGCRPARRGTRAAAGSRRPAGPSPTAGGDPFVREYEDWQLRIDPEGRLDAPPPTASGHEFRLFACACVQDGARATRPA
jgi:protein-S-isoprenylcysteine O-methyltransferase Ste14